MFIPLKHILTSVVCAVAIQCCLAQQDTVTDQYYQEPQDLKAKGYYVETLGMGYLYSLNFEHRLHLLRIGDIRGRIGVSGLPGNHDNYEYHLLAAVTYVTGAYDLKAEIGIGANFGYNPDPYPSSKASRDSIKAGQLPYNYRGEGYEPSTNFGLVPMVGFRLRFLLPCLPVLCMTPFCIGTTVLKDSTTTIGWAWVWEDISRIP